MKKQAIGRTLYFQTVSPGLVTSLSGTGANLPTFLPSSNVEAAPTAWRLTSARTVSGQGRENGPLPGTHHVGSGYTFDELKTLIRNPLSVNPQASMPAFDKPADNELQALVGHLLSLK